MKKANEPSCLKWLWFASAMLLPAAIMAYFYKQNQQYVNFNWILLIIVALCLCSAAAYWLVYATLRSAPSGFVFTLVCWISCFSVNYVMETVFASLSMTAFIVHAAITVIVAGGAAFLVRRKAKDPIIVIFVLSITGLLLLMNSLPLAFKTFKQNEADIPENYIKTDFAITHKDTLPNIYWFHCDGMLGFEAMEAWFGDSQPAFSQQLEARGFMINRTASFEAAHTTQMAIPCLMSPYAYDHWIAPRVETHEVAMATRNSPAMYEQFLKLRINNELFSAFNESSYYTNIFANTIYFFPVGNVNYGKTESQNAYKTEQTKSAHELMFIADLDNTVSFLDSISKYLSFTTKLATMGMDELSPQWRLDPGKMGYEYEVPTINNDILLQIGISEDGSHWVKGSATMIADVLQSAETPNFTAMWFSAAHRPFMMDENGVADAKKEEERSTLIADYPAQHRFTAKALINLVDMILDKDPDAVIVLQSDHGLHGNTEAEFEAAFGTSDAKLDMWNSVMSALRVPEQYKNGEEQFAVENPLNISRYLINNFVGRNYEYIETKE